MFIQVEGDLDALLFCPVTQCPDGLLDHLVEPGVPVGRVGAAGEFQQGPHDPDHSLQALLALCEVLAGRVILAFERDGKVDEPEDAIEGVVQLVGDARGELADDRVALGRGEPLFHLRPVGHVLDDDDPARNLAAHPAQGRGGEVQNSPLRIECRHPFRHKLGIAAANGPAFADDRLEHVRPRETVAVDGQCPKFFVQRLRGAESQDVPRRLVAEGHVHRVVEGDEAKDDARQDAFIEVLDAGEFLIGRLEPLDRRVQPPVQLDVEAAKLFLLERLADGPRRQPRDSEHPADIRLIEGLPRPFVGQAQNTEQRPAIGDGNTGE